MIRRPLFLTILFLLCFSLLFAAEGEQEFALFKRIVSPVMMWGENGVLTISKATTVGQGNLYVGIFGQQAGTLQGTDLYLTSATAMIGTSADVELGYTRRQLIWGDLYLSDMSMDTFHLKARVLDFGKDVMPSVAIGVNGVSISDNSFTQTSDILFNPYIVATSYIEIIPDFFDLSITALGETIMSAGKFGVPQFSIGVDAQLMDMFYVFAEMQGLQVDLDEFDLSQSMNEIVNLGAKVKYGWVSLGVGMFNIIRNTEEGEEGDDLADNIFASTFDLGSASYMATVVIEIPLDDLNPNT